MKMIIFRTLNLFRQLRHRKITKLKAKTKTKEIQKASTAPINEWDTISITGSNTTPGNKDN